MAAACNPPLATADATVEHKPKDTINRQVGRHWHWALGDLRAQTCSLCLPPASLLSLLPLGALSCCALVSLPLLPALCLCQGRCRACFLHIPIWSFSAV